MIGIGKSFPGVRALNNVNFNLQKGEVHALLGENGAGKSTLMKVLAGAYREDEGEIYISGKQVFLGSTRQAQNEGVGIVYQELELIQKLSVAENLFLGNELAFHKFPLLIKRKEMELAASKILNGFGLDSINPSSLVEELGIAEQQLVEIAKVTSKTHFKILILDEPTSALEKNEIETMYNTINMLKERGVGIIYISHKLDEIFRISDRITILRDGNYVDTVDTNSITQSTLIKKMVGRELKDLYPKQHVKIGPELLRLENVSSNILNIHNISFTLNRGEIVGVYGLMGAGKTELGKTIFGVKGGIDKGNISIKGKKVSINSVQDAISQGIGLVPEDRRDEGLILNMSVTKNITISAIDQVIKNNLISYKRERDTAKIYKNDLGIVTGSLETKVRNLSGGNQQKVVISRWLFGNTEIFICDEPTRGIDVGAKIQVYNLLSELASKGVGILFISSELPEILSLSDKIIVLRDGMISGVVDGRNATEENIVTLAIGGNIDE